MKLFHPALILLLALAILPAYTATITDAQIDGTGVCLRIKICWDIDSETAPHTGNTQGTSASEIDVFSHDPCGEDQDGGTPIQGTYTVNGDEACREFWFCFPQNDCEFGNEEYSAQVVITDGAFQYNVPANGANGLAYEENIC